VASGAPNSQTVSEHLVWIHTNDNVPSALRARANFSKTFGGPSKEHPAKEHLAERLRQIANYFYMTVVWWIEGASQCAHRILSSQ